jgi:hypothetical protein
VSHAGRPQRNELRGERRPSFAFLFAREAKCIACMRLLLEVVFATQKHCARSKMKHRACQNEPSLHQHSNALVHSPNEQQIFFFEKKRTTDYYYHLNNKLILSNSWLENVETSLGYFLFIIMK